jgi:hypothetical protein
MPLVPGSKLPDNQNGCDDSRADDDADCQQLHDNPTSTGVFPQRVDITMPVL